MQLADTLTMNRNIIDLPVNIQNEFQAAKSILVQHIQGFQDAIQTRYGTTNEPIPSRIKNDNWYVYSLILILLVERRQREWQHRAMMYDSQSRIMHLELFSIHEMTTLDNIMTLHYDDDIQRAPRVLPRDFLAVLQSSTPNTRIEMYYEWAQPQGDAVFQFAFLTDNEIFYGNIPDIVDYYFPPRFRPGVLIPYAPGQYVPYPLPNYVHFHEYGQRDNRYAPLPHESSEVHEFYCPSCHEVHNSSDTPYWRCDVCGHSICMRAAQEWNEINVRHGRPFTCVMCRHAPGRRVHN
jgi:hypothetical protein